MKNRFIIKANDVYIIVLFIYLVVAFFAKTTTAFSYLGYIAVGTGLLTLILSGFKKSRTITIILLATFITIIYFSVSSVAFDVSVNSPTTHGRLIGSSLIMLNLVLFSLSFSTKEEDAHVHFIFLFEIICIITTFARYSLYEIYEGVLGHIRLGERLNGGNLFGMLMALFSIFQCYRLALFRKTRVIDFLILFIDVVLVASSGSRKAFIGMFAGVALLFLFLSKKNKIITICRIALVASLLFFVLSSLSITSGVFERLSTLWSDSNQLVSRSDEVRFEMILFALQSALKRPVFGYGFDSYTTYSVFHTYSHNNYAELLFNNGILGLILYYFPKLFILINLVKTKTIRVRQMTAFYVSIMVILLIYDFACVSYYDTLMNMFWWLAGAYLFYVLSGKKREETVNYERSFVF